MTRFAIRPARVTEAQAVLDLWREAGALPSKTDTPREVRRLVKRHPGALLVAVDGGRLIGTVIAGWDGWRGGIYRLAVAPDRRRRGLARALVAAAERRIRARGGRRISAMVVRAERHAVGFWSHAPGWRRARHMDRYVRML